jgi:hypothetical protein
VSSYASLQPHSREIYNGVVAMPKDCQRRYFGWVLGLISVTLAFAVAPAHGALVVRIPDVTVFSDNVNTATGVVIVDLGVSPSPGELVSSYNIDFTGTGGTGGLSFSAPLPPDGTPPESAIPGPLFTAGMSPNFTTFGSYPSTHVQAANDILSPPPPDTVAAVDGNTLLRVPFSVAPGHVGEVYTLTLSSMFTQVADFNGVVYPISLDHGTITVAAIPEAAAWRALLIVALISAIVVATQRRRVAIA